MIRKKTLLVSLLFIFSLSAFSQKKEFTYKFYGFVKTDVYADTYKGLDVAHEDFYVVPYYTGKDANGNDFNQTLSANITALFSRAGIKMDGPTVLKARTSGVMEVDFGGITREQPNLLRIRLAFVDMNWNKTRLRIGQDWHPFWADGVFSTVGSFNTGVPFQPFNRSPLIRSDFYFGKFSVGGALISENQFTSKVFDDGNYMSHNQAHRNGGMPAYAIFVSQQFNKWKIGVGGELKRIKPRLSTQGSNGTFKANEYLLSYSTSAFAQYKNDKLKITAHTVYGQNMTHLTMLGGYAVKTRNEQTGAETYTNYNNMTSLLNIVYGKKWRVGAFGGYGKNLGTNEAVYNNNGAMVTAGLLQSVQSHWRASAHTALSIQNMLFALEYELTQANYGEGEVDFSNGLHKNTHSTMNHRLVLSMTYTF